MISPAGTERDPVRLLPELVCPQLYANEFSSSHFPRYEGSPAEGSHMLNAGGMLLPC